MNSTVTGVAHGGGEPIGRVAHRWAQVAVWGVMSAAAPTQAATIYLCKAYSGGMFWASTHCSGHRALIDRIVAVPDGMPWDQQVQLAESNRAEAARLAAPPPAAATVDVQPQVANPGKVAECQVLAANIRQFDALARQALSGQAQDQITAARRQARDRQFQLRC
jgi:hypothetical protein